MNNLINLAYIGDPVLREPTRSVEIEKIIRDQASAISKELEGNPSPKEKISDKEED